MGNTATIPVRNCILELSISQNSQLPPPPPPLAPVANGALSVETDKKSYEPPKASPILPNDPTPPAKPVIALPDGSYRQVNINNAFFHSILYAINKVRPERQDDTPAMKTGADWYERAIAEQRSVVEYPEKQGVRAVGIGTVFDVFFYRLLTAL